ncbi:MAG: hypothetical protein DWH91_05080 [Planctomycetota bacterium]|nr:MAG: hypothetical protein DWH91_05080 [Planctomycetota bacterium]
MHPVASLITECARRISHSELVIDRQSLSRCTLTPWTVWLLMSLVRQVERQRWVTSILVSKLGVDMDGMSVAGALAHPPVPQSGLVPEHTDWEYYFHGRGCCLSNRITGESIDVDFYDGISDWIDDFFFVRFLESLKKPEPIEHRLIHLHPTIETVVLGINQLLDEGLLQKHSDSKVFKPLDDFQDLADDIEVINTELGKDTKRVSVANFLSDWLLTVTVESQGDSRASNPDAGRCISERRQYLESRFAESKSERLALMALCDLVPNSTEYLRHALSKSPSGTTSAALDIVARRSAEDWSEQVYGLMCRTDPSGELPQPYTWTKCAEYLLGRRAHVDDLREQFPRVGRRSLGDAAILALEYFPDLAVELFRRALRSDVPMDRITAAAALAILDQPWSHNLLLALLQETRDHEATAESRAALMAMRHIELHHAVTNWEQNNPHQSETGPYITMTEMSLRNRDSRIQHEMEQLHDRVIRLRSVIPPDSPKPPSARRWWPF